VTFEEAAALARQKKRVARTANPEGVLTAYGDKLLVEDPTWCSFRPPTAEEKRALDWALT
jgi:hypothetical protein